MQFSGQLHMALCSFLTKMWIILYEWKKIIFSPWWNVERERNAAFELIEADDDNCKRINCQFKFLWVLFCYESKHRWYNIPSRKKHQITFLFPVVPSLHKKFVQHYCIKLNQLSNYTEESIQNKEKINQCKIIFFVWVFGACSIIFELSKTEC